MKQAKTMRISSLFYIACGMLIGIYAANNFQVRAGSDIEMATQHKKPVRTAGYISPEHIDSLEVTKWGN